MTTSLTFQEHSLEIIKRKGSEWIIAAQIGDTLGYHNPSKKINELYQRHKDEFTPSMVQKIHIPTNGGEQEVLAFSLRGAHLLAMFSRTPIAAQFRHWVLDVLEERQARPRMRQKPHSSAALSARLEECERLYGEIMTRSIMLKTILERQNMRDMHWHKMALSLSNQIVHVLYGISLHKNITIN